MKEKQRVEWTVIEMEKNRFKNTTTKVQHSRHK